MHFFKIPSLILVVLFSNMSMASSSGTGQWPIEIFEVMDDKKIVVFLHNEDITDSPQWQPEKNGPQMTVAEVLQHVYQWRTKDRRMVGAQVQEIELKPIKHHEQEHRWYYLVKLHNEKGGVTTTYYVAVLFNGKVVPAIVEPAPIK